MSLIILLVPLAVVIPYAFKDGSAFDPPVNLRGWFGDLILLGIPAATFILGAIGIFRDPFKRWAWMGMLVSGAFVALFGYPGLFWFFHGTFNIGL